MRTTVTQYRDGEPLRTQTRPEPFHAGSHDLWLGTCGGGHTLQGALDEVKIWDRPLTPDEIRREASRKWGIDLPLGPKVRRGNQGF